jgi:transposase
MANCKSMAVTSSIVALYRGGWSKSGIARRLGINRETVARYVRLNAEAAATAESADSKPAIPPAGVEGSKPAILHAGKSGTDPGRRSRCEPHHDLITAKLEAGLTAQRIYQDLRDEHGFSGAYDAVKRFCGKLKAREPDRIWRVECLPGEEAQVDFATGYYLQEADGRRRKVHLLRVVLSHSRKGYTEAVERQSAEHFLRGLENAFRHFGGVPQTLCIDNLRAAVKRADWYEPELSPKIEQFCRHYGTVVLPCRPRTPEHKGKVENGVQYVQENALKGRSFPSLAALNAHLRQWEATIADLRIHGTTRQQVARHFHAVERPALQTLPPDLFPCFQEGQRTVHSDSHVQIGNAYYEVPAEYIGQQVWVRWDARLVRVYNQRFEQLCVLSVQRPGQFTAPLGARGRSSGGVERDKAYWLRRCARLGDHCGLWALEVIAQRGDTGIRVLQGLVHMAGAKGGSELDRACQRALSHGAYRLADLRRLLAQPTTQTTLSFMDNHPLIRDLREYTAFLELLDPPPQSIWKVHAGQRSPGSAAATTAATSVAAPILAAAAGPNQAPGHVQGVGREHETHRQTQEVVS